jgi:hypothetical protein
MRATVLLLALLLPGFAPTVEAQGTCAPHLVGADRRGPASAISHRGDRLYLGNGAAVSVVDTTDYLTPVERGHVNLDELVRGVAHWQTTAIALSEHRLAFIDAVDPDHPAVVGSFPFPDGWTVNRVTAREWLAWVPETNGLHVIDFSDPTAPIEIGSFAVAAVKDVVLNGARAYLLAGEAILVLDISNPALPVLVRTVAISDSADEHLSIAGNGARLAAWGGWTYGHHGGSEADLYSLADPDRPVPRSNFWYEDWGIDDIEFAGDRAYISELVYDVSDLANPVYLGDLSSLVWGYDMARTPDPNLLYVADPQRGLELVDASDPANPTIAAHIDLPGPTNDVYLVGSLAVAVDSQGLRVFDLGASGQPALLGSVSASGDALDQLARAGDHAFVGSYVGLRNFDLSDPSHPTEAPPLSSYNYEPPVVDGDRLYVRDEYGEHVSIFDVSDPASPRRLGAVHVSDNSYEMDFTAHQGVLYLWHYYYDQNLAQSLLTFDVGDPGEPVELGTMPTATFHMGRSLAWGPALYLADETALGVVDISDPANPVRLADFALPRASRHWRRVSRYGSWLLVAPNVDYWYGDQRFDDRLFVLDVSDPFDPHLVTAIETPGDARGAFAGPGRILVADGPAGISVYSTCALFTDSFESGDASAWSTIAP